MRLRKQKVEPKPELVPLAFVDIDDTMLCTQPIYDAARMTVARSMHPANPVRGAEFLRAVDTAYRNFIDPTVSVGSFGRALQAGQDAYAAMSGRFELAGITIGAPIPLAEEDITAIGSVVTSAKPSVLPGVEMALEELQHAGYTLVAFTKGDETVQRTKLIEAGLYGFFARVVVTPVPKTRDLFANTLCAMHGDPTRSVSFGDSLAEDGAPALEAGIHSFYMVSPFYKEPLGHETLLDAVISCLGSGEADEQTT